MDWALLFQEPDPLRHSQNTIRTARVFAGARVCVSMRAAARERVQLRVCSCAGARFRARARGSVCVRTGLHAWACMRGPACVGLHAWACMRGPVCRCVVCMSVSAMPLAPHLLMPASTVMFQTCSMTPLDACSSLHTACQA